MYLFHVFLDISNTAQFAFEFILDHVCHQVVVLDKSNVAAFAFESHFVIQEEWSQRSNSGHFSVEVLLFPYTNAREVRCQLFYLELGCVSSGYAFGQKL